MLEILITSENIALEFLEFMEFKEPMKLEVLCFGEEQKFPQKLKSMFLVIIINTESLIIPNNKIENYLNNIGLKLQKENLLKDYHALMSSISNDWLKQINIY